MNIILFSELPKNSLIPHTDERARHIMNVLHLKPGDGFRMGLVNGPAGTAVVREIGREGVRFSWTPQPSEVFRGHSPVGLYPVTLMVAQVRPISMKRILREAVSLGADRIIAFGTDTGEKSYRDAKLWTEGRYRDQLISGAQQSGYTGVPEVSLYDTLDKAVAALDTADRGTSCFRIVLDPVVGFTHLAAISLPDAERHILAIGPERGWSERERALLTANGFTAAGLGYRILRTETACSAGLTLLISRTGRF